MAKKPPAEPRPPGRPSKCTPELTETICGFMRDGMWAKQAACLAKIDERTFHRWVEWGSEGREPYAAFCLSLKEAEAEAERRALETVRMGAVGPEAVNWQSAAWYLERRHPERYGKRDPHRQEIAELEKRCKQLEVETAEAKLALLKRGIDPDDRVVNIIIPSVDDIAHDPTPVE